MGDSLPSRDLLAVSFFWSPWQVTIDLQTCCALPWFIIKHLNWKQNPELLLLLLLFSDGLDPSQIGEKESYLFRLLLSCAFAFHCRLPICTLSFPCRCHIFSYCILGSLLEISNRVTLPWTVLPWIFSSWKNKTKLYFMSEESFVPCFQLWTLPKHTAYHHLPELGACTSKDFRELLAKPFQ